MPKKEERPIPYDFSDWDDRMEVFYQCPKCTQSFKLYGRYERYCHNCGLKIKWADMPRRCTKDQRLRLDAAYHSYEAGTNDFESYDRKKAEILHEIYCVPDIQKVVGAE